MESPKVLTLQGATYGQVCSFPDTVVASADMTVLVLGCLAVTYFVGAFVSQVYGDTLNFWPLWSNATFACMSYPQEVNPEEAAVTDQPLSRQASYHQSTREPEAYFSMNAWRT